MNVANGFWIAFLQLVLGLLQLYMWVIIARALVSWVNPDPYNPIVRFLVSATEPVLRPVRRLVPPRKLGGIDLSPLIVIALIWLIRQGLINAFFGYGFRRGLL